MVIGSDTKAVLLTAGLIFLGGAAARGLEVPADGDVKGSARSPLRRHRPPGRVALQLRDAPARGLRGAQRLLDRVNLVAAFVPIVFFVGAIVGYTIHGWRRDTDNQFRDPVPGTHAFMWALIIGEIGGVVGIARRLRRRPDLRAWRRQPSSDLHANAGSISASRRFFGIAPTMVLAG